MEWSLDRALSFGENSLSPLPGLGMPTRRMLLFPTTVAMGCILSALPGLLDHAVMETDQARAASLRRTRRIGDFSAWKDHDENHWNGSCATSKRNGNGTSHHKDPEVTKKSPGFPSVLSVCSVVNLFFLKLAEQA